MLSSPLTISVAVRDELRRQRDFPVTARATFLAHAAVAPLPRTVLDAITTTATSMASLGQFSWITGQAEERCRRSLASLLNVDADEIAFTTSTSAGLATVAAGWRLVADDEVLVVGGDFSAIVAAWRPVQARHVRIRVLPTDRARPLDPDTVLAALTPRTRVVTVSTAHWITGSPVLNLCALGQDLRRRDIRLVVDAVQTLGAHPVCGKHADVVIADGHKWLLDPQAFGVLMVRRHLFDEVDPALPGWRSFDDGPPLTAAWRCDARRYEAGGLNLLGLVGLDAALQLLTDQADLRPRSGQLRHQLAAALHDDGHHVLGGCGGPWSSIIAFRPASGNVAQVHDDLVRQHIVVSVRETNDGRAWLRAAPHYYNTSDDLRRLIEALRPYRHS